MFDKDQKASSLKIIAGPVGLLVLLVLLFFMSVKIGSANIKNSKSLISDLEGKNKTLTAKLGTLREIENDVSDASDITSVALPQENPALVAVSQIKYLASANNTQITNLEVGKGFAKEEVSELNMGFDVSGQTSDILRFLASVKTVAPIVIVSDVSLSSLSGENIASTSVIAHWSDFPAKIPALSENIETLTKEEEKLLSEVSELVQPEFFELEAQAPAPDRDPFSY